MKIAIAGFDVEGRASYDYFLAQGEHDITILDQNPLLAVPNGVPSVLGENYLDDLNRFDLIVRTPGLQPRRILNKNPEVTGKITTQINEFMRVSPTRQIIGVTGTKGKGTTSTLIARMLEAAGKKVHLAGNIGVPALSLLSDIKADDWVVLELSSFQLIDLHLSPHIAVCLMVVPEHLDWHTDVQEYYTAKSQLFVRQTPEDTAIFYANNDVSRQIANVGSGQKVPYFAPPGASIIDGAIQIGGKTICLTSELKLLGEHNWQNVCAAVTAVWQVTQDTKAIKEVLTSFAGLPFRLEFVRELDNVKYYNDSFGTTPETATVAIKAFAQPKVVILGGSDKGASYDELAKTVASSSIRKVLLIGDQAQRIQTALEGASFHDFQPGGANMTEIVANARAAAMPGDVVILSPACASFGMFKNYKDRGNQFNQAVAALA
ncbi:MAG TPA: UDP-N-acetylmuramoyl-L-alanine--D-glutamate ligase [Candidatus Saccharimonadales bacterium]|nr:UDP-N-acetylmuramoyl-L-alanine--D-glutamate ligase [Candidatus Saccharimonadales bacterium]